MEGVEGVGSACCQAPLCYPRTTFRVALQSTSWPWQEQRFNPAFLSSPGNQGNHPSPLPSLPISSLTPAGT